MLNYIWGAMILLGVMIGAINGKISEVTEAFIESSKEAISLCIVMIGVVSMWNGLMKVAQTSGLIEQLAKKMSPIIQFLYPNLPKNNPAREYIAANMIANIFGLGWAATPTGLKAMEELSKLDKERNIGKTTGIASNEMCTFLIINISSLQLIPVNMIAYRSQYGSVNPTAIVGPAIVATLISTITGIIFAKVMNRKKYKTKHSSFT